MKSDLFRRMPPRRHDRDLSKSGVIAFISETLGCDMHQADRTFHYLRNKRHLVFDKAGRWWRGAEFTPLETEEEARARVQGEITALRARVAYLEGRIVALDELVAKLREGHNRLAVEFEQHLTGE